MTPRSATARASQVPAPQHFGRVWDLASMDVAAQNHALIEGAPDPYPYPKQVRDRHPRLSQEVPA